MAFERIDVGGPEAPEGRQPGVDLQERLGLTQPLLQQYFTFITNFFRGEMGVSFSRYPDDVSTVLWNALPRTLVLFLSATIFAFWLGFKAGKFIAWRDRLEPVWSRSWVTLTCTGEQARCPTYTRLGGF